MSETGNEKRAGSPESVGDAVADETTGGADAGSGSGGSLFKRMSDRVPQGSRARRWAFASGAVVALVAAGFGVRQWRRR